MRAWHVAVLLNVPLATVLTTGWIATNSAHVAAPRAAEANSTPTARSSAKQSAVASFRARPFPFVRTRLQNRYAPTNFGGYRAHPKDRHGVPERIYRGDRYYAPSGVAWAGLEMLGKYLRTGDRKSLAIARACADELRDLINQAGGSGWLPWPVPNGGNHLRAPWYNALSQGLALALFSRFYQLEHHPADGAECGPRVHHLRAHRPGPVPVGRPGHPQRPHLVRAFCRRLPRACPERPSVGHIRPLRLLVDRTVADVPQVSRWWRHDDARSGPQVPKAGTFAWYCLVHKVAHARYQGFVVRELQALGADSADALFSRLAGLLHRDYS